MIVDVEEVTGALERLIMELLLPSKSNSHADADQAGHPAGPHAATHLTDSGRTPGAGSLPDPRGGDVDPGVG